MIGGASLAGCGADREDDERQNLAILHQLPTPPGARELEISTSPYFGDEEGPWDRADGHTTLITYRAPAGTTQRGLIRFYRSRLNEDWNCQVQRSGVVDITGDGPRRVGVQLQLACKNDTASISVNPDNLTTRKASFEVAADHRDGRT
jgi:hypothetical protein